MADLVAQRNTRGTCQFIVQTAIVRWVRKGHVRDSSHALHTHTRHRVQKTGYLPLPIQLTPGSVEKLSRTAKLTMAWSRRHENLAGKAHAAQLWHSSSTRSPLEPWVMTAPGQAASSDHSAVSFCACRALTRLRRRKALYSLKVDAQ